MGQENDAVFLTVQEVSQLLQLSILTIYKYIREGVLDAVEFGGHYRIEKAALKKFIDNHKVKKKEVTDE